MCMQRQGQVELLPFDPELEITLHRLHKEQREAHQRNLAVMQNQKGKIRVKSKTSRKGDRMGIMVGTMLPSHLYSQMIRLCC